MAIEIKVPDIGTDEVEITEILVKVGDKVEAEQSLITVEGDKASMEVPSPQAGVVKEIKVSVGDKTETGALIMIFDSADGAADAAPAKAEEKKEAAPAAAPAAAAAKDVHVPERQGLYGSSCSVCRHRERDQSEHRRQSLYRFSDYGLRSGG
nr:biotin/lipoyl-containing protein [Salmonella enterica subsp. enterica serovar Newport str. CFSAN001891]